MSDITLRRIPNGYSATCVGQKQLHMKYETAARDLEIWSRAAVFFITVAGKMTESI